MTVTDSTKTLKTTRNCTHNPNSLDNVSSQEIHDSGREKLRKDIDGER